MNFVKDIVKINCFVKMIAFFYSIFKNTYNMSFLLDKPIINIPPSEPYYSWLRDIYIVLQFSLPVSDHDISNYDKIIKLKKNTKKFKRIVDKIEKSYITSSISAEISTKKYNFIDCFQHPFQREFSMYLVSSNDLYDESNTPRQKFKYYMKVLAELSKSYLYYKYKGMPYTEWNLLCLYILSSHYFDKIENTLESQMNLSKKSLMLFKIDFYKSIIAGRTSSKNYAYWIGNVPMVFDMNIIWSKKFGSWDAEENTNPQFYKKDILYKRLEQSKRELRDFTNNEKLRKVVSDLFQSQSKYISLIRDRYILKGIITEMKNDIEFWDDKDCIGVKLQNITLNMPNTELLQLAENYLEDEHFENYFQKFLNKEDKKGLKKIIKLFSPNDIKHNVSNKKKAEQLFELFKQKGTENEVNTIGKLPSDNLKIIYEYANI